MIKTNKIMSIKSGRAIFKSVLCLAAFSVSSLSMADDAGSGAADVSGSAFSKIGQNFQVSGFLTVTGGNIIGGGYGNNYAGPTQLIGVNCPCYTADWSNGGVYNNDFSLKPESRAGLQIQYNFSPQFNFVGQAVVRGTDGTPNVNWAYFNYKLDDHWEVHVGRQRIPLYYYSPFQDAGFAYPWVNVPPELYGWDATNYNGASLRYTNSFGNTNLTTSVFGGEEKVAQSAYYALSYSGDNDVHWDNIVGADAEINNGPLTVRAVYLQAKATNTDDSLAIYSVANLKAYGMAVNLDFDSWFLLSEVTQLERDYTTAPIYSYTAPASTIGVGWRLGKWTPFVNYALYTQHNTPNLPAYAAADYKRLSGTLRYDIDSNSDVKLQLDRNFDTTQNWGGSVNVFRISYDRVF